MGCKADARDCLSPPKCAVSFSFSVSYKNWILASELLSRYWAIGGVSMPLGSKFATIILAALGLVLSGVAAQERPGPVISRDVIPGKAQEETPPSAEGHLVDGGRHGQPIERFAVVPGTRFLVRLEG